MRCKDLKGFGPVGTNGPVMYPEVDHMLLGDLYVRHVAAMTAEGLHAKSDIAAQLAWRDQRIASLTAQLEAVRRDAELWRAHVSRGGNTSHRCKQCGLPYNPVTENEDCPDCGYDGKSPIDDARHQEATNGR